MRKPDWLNVDADVKSAEIDAIVFRADGSTDWDASRIIYWHRNPLKMAWWILKNGKEGKRSLRKRQQQGG